MLRLHSGAAIDNPETTELQPIPEVVWQQLQETQLKIIPKKLNYVQLKTSPTKETSPRVSGTEPLLGKQTRNTPVQCLNDSKKRHFEIQRKETDMTANDSGDD